MAWANFINGAGPGSHGIFDFIHRHPHEQCAPFYSAAETLPGEGYWEVGDHRLQLDFWPFNHQPPEHGAAPTGRSVLGLPRRRREFLRPSTTCRPTIRPARRSTAIIAASAGWERRTCWAPTARTSTSAKTHAQEGLDEGGGRRTRLSFDGDSATATVVGPPRTACSKSPSRRPIEFEVHRDVAANAALLEVQGREDPAQARPVESLDPARFRALHSRRCCRRSMCSGICRFYLQEVRPEFSTVRHADQRRSVRARPCSCRSPPSFVRTSRSNLGCSTRPASRKITRPARTVCLSTTSSCRQATHGARRTTGAVRIRRRELRRRVAVLLFLQQRPAVAHVLVELRRTRIRRDPPRGAEVLRAHQAALPADSMRSSATSTTATAARRRSS